MAGVDLDPQVLAIARDPLGPDFPLNVGDMVDLDLGQTFDVVTCLFTSIAYAWNEQRLGPAVERLAGHARGPGLVLVEPFFTPEHLEPGHPWAVFVDQLELKVARMDVPEVRDGFAVLNVHYLVATPSGVEHLTEPHEVGLFTGDHSRVPASGSAPAVPPASMNPQPVLLEHAPSDGAGILVAIGDFPHGLAHLKQRDGLLVILLHEPAAGLPGGLQFGLEVGDAFGSGNILHRSPPRIRLHRQHRLPISASTKVAVAGSPSSRVLGVQRMRERR